jgi:hypothetical protein
MQNAIPGAKNEVSGNPWLNSAFNRHAAGVAPEDYEDQVGTEAVYPKSFLDLDDCLERSYLGQNQKLVSVDAGTPGLRFVDALGNCYWKARGPNLYYTKGSVSVGTPDVSHHGANFLVSKLGSGAGAETVVLDLEYRAEDDQLIGAKNIFVFSHLHWSSQIGSIKTGAIGIGAENEWASYVDLSYLGTLGTGGAGDGQFNGSRGIDSTASYIFVVDKYNCRIQKFDFSTNAFVSKAGSAGSANTQLQDPAGMVHYRGRLYICDTVNDRLIVWSAEDLSYVTKYGSSGTGINNLNNPHSVCTDGTYLYITDYGNDRIMKRLLSTLAYVAHVGTTGSGDDQFNYPTSISTDGEFLYISDEMNKRIQKRRCDDLSFVKKLDVGQDIYASAYIDGYIYASFIVGATFGLTKYTTEFDWVSYSDLGSNAPVGMMARDSRIWISVTTGVDIYLRTPGGSGQYFDSFMGFYIGRYGALVETARISSGGNFYIGKTLGSYKLDVAGSIRADNQVISSAPVGTSPLAVTSTTVVTNLNADYLDGYHESSFIRLTPVLGSTIYGDATPAWAVLAGNATLTKKWLSQTGTGTVSAAPAWGTIAIDDLSDVALVAAATGDLLRFDGSNWVDYADSNYATAAHVHTGVYEPALGNPGTDGWILSSTALGVRSWVAAGGSLALDDLTDVNAPSPSDTNVLSWNSATSKWIPAAAGGSLALDDLTDVNAPSPGDNDFLSWDSATSKWIPVAGGGGGAVSFVDLDDVPASYASQGLKLVRVNTGETALEFAAQSALKLDDFGAPDDNTDLNASTSAHGLLKKLSNVATEFLNGQGSFAVPAGSYTVTDGDCSFLDSFADSSLYWTWKSLNTSAAKTIAETTSLAIHIDNGTTGDWSGTLDCPLIYMEADPPCEVIAKKNSGNAGGIFVSKSMQGGGGMAYLFDHGSSGFTITSSGVVGYGPVGDGTLPCWMKIRIEGANAHNFITFWYSTDGINWTQFNSGGFSVLSNFYGYEGLNIGLNVRSGGSGAADAAFGSFQMVRSRGPR